MIVRRVSYAEILASPNAKDLLDEYAAECSIATIGEADPQPEMYAQMEKTGMFQAFAAYEKGLLIGFAAVLVYVLPHYGRRITTVESLFLAKQYRKWRAGNELMSVIEAYAKEMSCVAILYSARTGGQLEKLLMNLMPYERTNSVFCRSL